MRKKINTYIKLFRIKHYIKNLLIFAPLFFSGDIFSQMFLNALIGFVLFCFASSFVYIINDIKDIDKDRKHPIKCHRPIASGDVTVKQACIVSVGLLTFMFLILQMNNQIEQYTFIWLIVYLIINLIYSCGGKNIPILDIFILSIGFLLRIIFGGSVCGIKVSSWLYMTVMMISFYFGLGKRRNELKTINSNETRKVMENYTVEFLDKNMYMCFAIGIVFYSLWALERSEKLVWTIPVVLIICMKYNLILESNLDGDPVPTLLSSPVLLGMATIYLGIVFLSIYL